MTESNYSTIKPVQNLPNVFGVKSAKDKEKRDKRQNAHKRPEEKNEFDERRPNELEDKLNKKLSKNDTDEHLIDYCA